MNIYYSYLPFFTNKFTSILIKKNILETFSSFKFFILLVYNKLKI